ncbi:MAG: hypothetical protein H0V73_03610, partial [Chloroflexi bacterium]|nr:hypothetical protein [Chloroflexota bacterium]
MARRPEAASPTEAEKATPIGDPPHEQPAPSARPTRAAKRSSAPASPTAGPTARAVEGVRFVQPRLVPIQQATDLGSVQVLKHGNLYYLTDPFGDIHPDSRGLGLYHSDTRLLSCLALRVGGGRPVLLQGSMGANYRGSIQLTNPSADRNPAAKVHPELDVAGRTIGISRDRLIGSDGMVERVRITNHAERELEFSVELELGADGADIFEVRGYPRKERGVLLPIAISSTRATFGYDGLDGMRRSTHVAFSDVADGHGPIDDRSDDQVGQGGSVRFRWDVRLAPGDRRDLRWTIWSTTRRVAEGHVSDDARAQA